VLASQFALAVTNKVCLTAALLHHPTPLLHPDEDFWISTYIMRAFHFFVSLGWKKTTYITESDAESGFTCNFFCFDAVILRKHTLFSHELS